MPGTTDPPNCDGTNKRHRDIDAHPYSDDEQRVANWLVSKTGVGAGDDPIGFLMISHEYILNQRNAYKSALESMVEQGMAADLERIARAALEI